MKKINKIDGSWYIEINKYSDLTPLIEHFAEDRDFLFRGQGDSKWKITSSLERYLKSTDPLLKNNSIFEYQLNNFKKNLRGKGILETNLSDNELWALGQHYGLHTPLIDWSKSLFIALYFAFIEPYDSQIEYRSLYSIHYTSLKNKQESYNIAKSEYEKFEFVEHFLGVNSRLLNQNGLFTKVPLGFDFEQWIGSNFQDRTKLPVFFKINISNKLRIQILNILDLMNINPGTIFPDLVGASLNANHTLVLTAEKFKSQNNKPKTTNNKE